MREKATKNQCVKKEQGIANPLGKRLYTLREAAIYLGRTVWGMRELYWAGEIPIVRGDGNRKIFLDIVDLNEYITRNKSIYQ
jgi:hypothetical protein